MKKQFLKLAIIALIGLISCDNDLEIAKEPFVGKWSVSQAVLDGVIQNEWEGNEILIDQNNPDSGIYKVNTSPDESIWKKEGVWRKHPSGFVRDNKIDVSYSIENSELTVSFLIVQRQDEPCEEGHPCILPIKDHWIFVAKKK